MKTSIAMVSISGTFMEKLVAIAGAGFDRIEIFEQDVIASDHSPREVGKMVRDHGLQITLFQPFRDFEGLPEPLRALAFARAARKFDLMAELGTDLVLACSSVHPACIGGIDRNAEDFHALGELAAQRPLPHRRPETLDPPGWYAAALTDFEIPDSSKLRPLYRCL